MNEIIKSEYNALDEQGNYKTHYFKTSADQVVGLANVATSGSYDDLSNKPTIPVKSVNGKTGDVVVGEVTNLSISGKTITVTFADNTTKTLTTQDTAPYSGSATSIGGASTTKPAVVVTTYRSGNNWYRVWSDGWIEQGGVVTGTSGNQNNQNNYQTITLHKAFDNANYNVAFSLNINEQSTAIDTFTQIWSKTSKQFIVRLCDTGNTNTLTYTWYACGKGA